ncbi:MAG: 50S ribosomal protein L4 [Patescibacteria group bacterium]
MEHIVYNQQGKETGRIALPEGVFAVKWNPDLVHQVATSMASSARAGTAHAKNRGEVRGGGKKPWRQKGTGRARHGSIRSPLWVGGGVTHGPRSDKNYSRKVNKKMKQKALYSALSAKLRDGEILFVNALAIPEIKTKEARQIITNLARIEGLESLEQKKKNSALFLLPRKETTIEKSFRNIGNVLVGEARNLNVPDVLKYKYVVFVSPEESLRSLTRP